MEKANNSKRQSSVSDIPANPFFDNQLLTYQKVQSYFGLSVAEMKHAKANGLVDFIPIGIQGTGVKFRASAINRYILDKETRLKRRRVS
jgi:hypothetical protein